MTLVQLKYIVAIARLGTISAAAKELYISQPSLTAAVKELEAELGITIFSRTNKGVILTAEGEEFLGYARQVIEQTELIQERYTGARQRQHLFCVSTQHYSFAVEAYNDLLKNHDRDTYDFRLRETQTYEIVSDVASLKSEVGVLYLNGFNETVLRKLFREKELVFHSLFRATPHVFVGAGNPLASREIVTLDDLVEFPRLSYEQGEHNSFYFSEEILSTRESKKDIMVRDRASLFNMLIGLNGYTICSGVINKELNGPNIRAIPLDVDDYMEIGYITHRSLVLSRFGTLYVEALQKYCRL